MDTPVSVLELMQAQQQLDDARKNMDRVLDRRIPRGLSADEINTWRQQELAMLVEPQVQARNTALAAAGLELDEAGWEAHWQQVRSMSATAPHPTVG